MDNNQLGRRNLTSSQFNLLIGRKYNRVKASHGGDRGNQYKKPEQVNDDLANRQIDGLPKQENKVSRKSTENQKRQIDAIDNQPKGLEKPQNEVSAKKEEVQKGQIVPSAKSTEPSFVNESTHDSSDELERVQNAPFPTKEKTHKNDTDLAKGQFVPLPKQEKPKGLARVQNAPLP